MVFQLMEQSLFPLVVVDAVLHVVSIVLDDVLAQ